MEAALMAASVESPPIRAAVAVHQRQSGRDLQFGHGPLHRQHAGVQDVDLVDLAFVGKAQAPGQGLLLDLGGQAFAAAFAELFGIRQPLDG
jgi:hypothetical protein